jgi:urease accessory protein
LKLEVPPVEQHPRPAGTVAGCLKVGFEYQPQQGRTVLATCIQQAPLRIVRAFPVSDGAALVHMHNLSGGVLGGDRLELEVHAGAHARAQLTSTGATRIYRRREGLPPAIQRTSIKVHEHGLLEYLPDPLIPFAGSRYCQDTRIELAEGAGLFWWETVAPGRDAAGEVFAYDLLQISLDLRALDRPIALERLRLEPALRPLSSPARLGPYRYFATFYICRVGVDPARWSALEAELSDEAQRRSCAGVEIWGVSTLPAHGLVVRALSRSGSAIAAGLPSFWHTARRELYGQAVALPRKLY